MLNSAAQIVPEQVLWSYMVQISNAIRIVHRAGLAVRVLDPTKILLCPNGRLRVSSVGIMDVIDDTDYDTAQLQAMDLHALGQILVVFTTNNPAALLDVEKSLSLVAHAYSAEYYQALVYLLYHEQGHPTIAEFQKLIVDKIAEQLDAEGTEFDRLEEDLCKEIENGRVARILTKLCIALDRPDSATYGQATRGDQANQYLLRLFYDYVFHQIEDVSGAPLLNYGHILNSLAKLDAGSNDKICLTSPDEQTCIIPTFAELKRVVQAEFDAYQATRVYM